MLFSTSALHCHVVTVTALQAFSQGINTEISSIANSVDEYGITMEEQKLPVLKGAKTRSGNANRRAKFQQRGVFDASTHAHRPRTNLKANTIEWSSASSSQLFDWEPKQVITFDQMVEQVNEDHEEGVEAGSISNPASSPPTHGLKTLVNSVEDALTPWLESGKVTPGDVEEVLAGLVAKQVMRSGTLSPHAHSRTKHELPKVASKRHSGKSPLVNNSERTEGDSVALKEKPKQDEQEEGEEEGNS